MTTATPEETPASAPATKKKPLTPKEWAKIDALWESGEVTYADLIKRFDRNLSTFERHFRKHGIKKGAARERIKDRVSKELESAEVSEAQVMAKRIRETKEEHYRMATALGRLTWAEILEAKKNKVPMATALNNLKALNAAIVNLKVVREERYAVLGLDRDDAVDPDQIPELIISELTEDQIKALRERDHTEVEGAPVVQSSVPDDEPESEDDGIVESS